MKIRALLILCIPVLGVACSDNLNSLDGPTSGTISGLVCNDVASLSAVLEFPIVQDTYIADGKCLRLPRRAGVKVIRTVMMPGDGKYSQFETQVNGSSRKLWIKTNEIRQAS